MSFRERVFYWVARIPPGKVATYGQIALLAGKPDAARLIGGILRGGSDELPWQRVIAQGGKISTYRLGFGELQRALLEAEGVRFDDLGRCDMNLYAWKPDTETSGDALTGPLTDPLTDEEP